MKRIFIFATMFLLLASIATAACTDSDNGPNYAEKGDTKIISGKEDICIISPSAEVRTDASPYLKEYFCDKDDQIVFEIVDCVREGFTGCEFGECFGGIAGAQAQDSNYTPPAPEPFCGDMVVDEGEDCDPKNKMCADDDGNIGLCDENCKCEIKIMRDGSKTESNDTTDITTTDVVVDAPVEVDTTPKPLPVVTKDESDEDKGITVTIADRSEPNAPTGFFSRIWSWIVGLFS